MKTTVLKIILLFFISQITIHNPILVAQGAWQELDNKEYVVADLNDDIFMKPGENIKINLHTGVNSVRYYINGVQKGYLEPIHGYVVLTNLPQNPGSYNLEFRVMTAASVVSIYSNNLEVVPLPSKVYTQSGTSNRMVKWQNTSTLKKPVLIVEGFDPVNVTFPAFYYSSGREYIERFLDLGHSVLILNFGNGGADMRDNSEILQSALLKINDLTPDSIILIGISMGGVISRHALVNMEDSSVQHNVSHFVSLDSPQQGAVIDEAFLDYTYGEEPNNEALGSIAAKQLLKYNPYRSENYHQSFYSELQNMANNGYPLSPKKHWCFIS